MLNSSILFQKLILLDGPECMFQTIITSELCINSRPSLSLGCATSKMIVTSYQGLHTMDTQDLGTLFLHKKFMVMIITYNYCFHLFFPYKTLCQTNPYIRKMLCATVITI